VTPDRKTQSRRALSQLRDHPSAGLASRSKRAEQIDFRSAEHVDRTVVETLPTASGVGRAGSRRVLPNEPAAGQWQAS